MEAQSGFSKPRGFLAENSEPWPLPGDINHAKSEFCCLPQGLGAPSLVTDSIGEKPILPDLCLLKVFTNGIRNPTFLNQKQIHKIGISRSVKSS